MLRQSGQRGLSVGLLAAVLCIGVGACDKEEQPVVENKADELKNYILDQAPDDIQKLDTDFDGRVKLLGYTIEPSEKLRAGKPVKLKLYWKVEKPLDSGWSLFTHLLDSSGQRIANFDGAGVLRGKGSKAALPLENWIPGKVYLDEQEFTLPRAIRSSEVKIATGLYKGKERIKIVSGNKDAADRAIVATLPVDGARRSSRTKRLPSLRVDKLEAKTKIAVDGKLDEPAWEAAQALELVNVDTGEADKSIPVSGSVKVLWGDTGFYVGFDVKDENILGGFDKAKKDPHLWTKDTVEIMVDPDGDGDNTDYYEIQIGPQNLVFDSQFDAYNEPKKDPDGPFGHEQWSSALKSAVTVKGTLDKPDDKDEGYVVEALLPWKSFSKAKKVPPAIGDIWRLNFYAMQDNSGVGWSPILKEGNFHKASRFGRVIWAEKGWTAKSAVNVVASGEAPADKLGRFKNAVKPELATTIARPAAATPPPAAAPAGTSPAK